MNFGNELVRAMLWRKHGEIGSSSLGLWEVMMGESLGASWPSDIDDFHRCMGVLTFVPEWRGRIEEMRTVGPEWERLVDRWRELESMYAEVDYRGPNENKEKSRVLSRLIHTIGRGEATTTLKG